MFILKKWQYAFLVLFIAWLTGCAPTTPGGQFKGMTAQQIFVGGETAMQKGKYDRAVKYFEGLEALYPFGPYAEQGQIDLIYAYYKNDDTASALTATDRYIHLYPQSDNADYVYYMRGLINFRRGQDWLQRKFKVDPSENDTAYLRQSYTDFSQLIERFPRSPYTSDARHRMAYIRNMMAQKELEAAQFYLNQKAYVAAVNRANNVIEHYQGAPQVIPALVVVVKADRALGLTEAANQALQVLQLNYPNAPELKELLRAKVMNDEGSDNTDQSSKSSQPTRPVAKLVKNKNAS